MNDVTEQLAAMLGTQVPPDDAADAARDAERYGPAVRPMQTNGAGTQTGRSGTGRLRNFRAMNDVKLLDCLDSMIAEANDVEGLRAVYAEAVLRGHRDPAALDAWLAGE